MPRTALGLFSVLLLLLLAPRPVSAQEPVDLDALTRIRNEGFRHSQVMDTVRHLTDEIGPRVTGSPQAKEASEWTRKQLADWGLANAHLEPYEFGRGWTWSGASLTLLKQREPLQAVPKGYTAGTKGPVHGPLMAVKIASEKDFDQYRGKLAGKVLLLDEAHDFSKDKAGTRRYTTETLNDLGQYKIPGPSDNDREKRYLERLRTRRARVKFFTAEKVLAILEASDTPWGVLRASGGGTYRPGEDLGPPSLVVAVEHYNRLLRLAEKNPNVEVELDVKVRYYDDDLKSYDTLAEIPGTDKADEVVMAGAHLDSWHTATGATDNAAGSAVVMEAVRILKALGIKPRRTIRVALWTGEEEGLIGSYAYVGQHFGSRPQDPELKDYSRYSWKSTGPITVKPEHAKLSAYFNLDNGSGKIRGIYAEENSAAVPIFEAWLRPLHDLGVDTVTQRHTGSTDHVPFDNVGLPAFQFIQDELDYMTMTHHTNMDTYDHLDRDDLMQASVVMASFLYEAAMRPEMMPRKPAQ
jgi:carboxypeptidase Q